MLTLVQLCQMQEGDLMLLAQDLRASLQGGDAIADVLVDRARRITGMAHAVEVALGHAQSPTASQERVSRPSDDSLAIPVAPRYVTSLGDTSDGPDEGATASRAMRFIKKWSQ